MGFRLVYLLGVLKSVLVCEVIVYRVGNKRDKVIICWDEKEVYERMEREMRGEFWFYRVKDY